MKTKNRNKKQSFIEGAAVLVMATAIVKLLGAVFKIPLGNLIGELGMGYFQTAYDLYLPIYSIALAGMPIAVCRMVASYMAKEQYCDARAVLTIAKRVFWAIGIGGTLLLLAAAYPYLLIIGGNQGALPGILVIAPCILFCCIMSTYRGYYEGLCNMTPTAVSQVIEAVGKVVIGLGLAFLTARLGYGPAYQSAAAIFGIMLGTAFGALYLRLRLHFSGDGITPAMLVKCGGQVDSNKQIFKALITIAVPVIIGSLASQIAGLIDVTTVQRRLSDIVQSNPSFFETNFPDMWAALLSDPEITTQEQLLEAIPTYLYGCYKGFAFSIYSLLPTITSVIGVSALPVMTTAFSAGDKKETKTTMESVIRVTSLLSMPAGFGIAAISEGILKLLYPAKPIGAAISAAPLTVLGIAVIFGGLSMPLTNLLQAIGKERIPVINMLVGALIKIGLNFWLVGQEGVNIVGAAISTLACYLFIVVSDCYFMVKYSGVKINFFASFFKPLFAAALCGLGTWASYGLLSRVVSGTLSTIGSIGIAAILYLIAVLLLRIITKNDLLMVPKGEKIAKVLEKLGWIG
ncbi:MAG: polysaccharide biosynthesis protein [Clostridia bacterium]|nr:polysaccharide biosynthesis protein [Clostridia bacterium]